MKRKLSNADNDDQPPKKQVKLVDGSNDEMEWTSLFQGAKIKVSSEPDLWTYDVDKRELTTQWGKDVSVDLIATIKNKQGIFFLTQCSCDYLVCGAIRKYLTNENKFTLSTQIKDLILKYTNSNCIFIDKSSNISSRINIDFQPVNIQLGNNIDDNYSDGTSCSIIDDMIVKLKFNQVCASSKNGDIDDDNIKEYLKYHEHELGKKPKLPRFCINPFGINIHIKSNGYEVTNNCRYDRQYQRTFFYDLCPLEEADQYEYDGKKLDYFETMDKFHASYHEDKRRQLSYMEQFKLSCEQKPICRRKWFQDLGTDGNHLEKQLRDKLVFYANYTEKYFKIFQNDNQMKNNNPFFKEQNDGKRRLGHSKSQIFEFFCRCSGRLNMSIEMLFNQRDVDKFVS